MTQIKVPDDLPDLLGEDMPPPNEILSAKQKNGKPLGADKIYKDTWLWLKGFKCERLVSPAMIEQYAMSVARWMQCEEALSLYGLLGKQLGNSKSVCCNESELYEAGTADMVTDLPDCP